MTMETPPAPDRSAERALLTRARRGDVEALRGMLHRYSSLVWAACALAGADEREAGRYFREAWEHIFRSLSGADLSPDLPGLLLSLCGTQLATVVSEDTVRRSVASAAQLAVGGEALEVPAEALRPVEERLAEQSARLAAQTGERRASRRERMILPASLALAVIVGLAAAYRAGTRPTPADVAARALRAEVLEGDLVTRLRDCASPPLTVIDLDPVESRHFEEISLVLEELANYPARLRSAQLAGLRARIEALDLVDFALAQAEKAQGDTRQDLLRVAAALEEVTNL
jgi:hypothetical protein